MNSLKLFTLVLISVFLTSCKVGKKAPIRQHEGPLTTTISRPNAQESSNEQTIASADLTKLYEASKQKNIDQVEVILKPLADIIFSAKVRLDPKVNRQDNTKWALQFFNHTILQVANSADLKASQSSEFNKILSRYLNALLEGCDSQSINNCLNFYYFKQDVGSSQVAKLLASRQKDVKTYYRLIFTAFELNGKRADKELTVLFESRMIELLKLYIKEVKRGETLYLSIDHLNSIQAKEYRTYTTLLATVLSISDQETKVLGFKNSAKTLMSWLASPSYAAALGAQLATELNLLITDWIKSPEIWDGLVQRMNAWEKQPGSLTQNIKSLPRPLVDRFKLEKLDLNAMTKDQPRSRIGLFLLSRIFNLNSSQQERYLWTLSDQNRKATILQIQSILQTAFMAKVYKSHQLMAKTLKRIQSDSLQKSRILSKTIEEGEQVVKPEWMIFYSQAKRLEDFFIAELESKSGQSGDIEYDQLVKDTRIMFNDLHQNVKLMVTYPIMTVFSYYAAKWEYAESVPFWTGGFIEINRRKYMNDLFNSDIGPLFSFTAFTGEDEGRNRTPLSKAELMTSMFFLFKAEILNQYGISIESFLQEVALTIKNPLDSKIRELTDKNLKTLSGNENYVEYLKHCHALRDQKVSSVLALDVRPEYIVSRTYLGIPGDDKSEQFAQNVTKTISVPFNVGMDGIDDAVETMRSNVDPKLRWLSYFKGVLKENMNIAGQKAGIDFIDLAIKSSEDLKNQLLELSKSYIHENTACASILAEAELSRQKQMTKMEIAFSEDVFLALEILEDLGDKGLLLVSQLQKADPNYRLFSDKRFKAVPENEPVIKALNSWLADRYNISEAFLAMPFYKESYDEGNAGIQRDKSGRYFFNHRYQDFVVRATLFLKNGYNGVTLQPKFEFTNVKWPEEANRKSIEGSQFEVKNAPVYLSRAVRRETRLSDFRYSFTSLIFQRTIWFQRLRSLPSIYKYLLKNEAALFRYDFERDLDSDVIGQCKEDCQTLVMRNVQEQMTRIIETTNTMVRQFSIDDEQKQFLETLGVDTYFLINLSGIYSQGPQDLFISSDTSGSYYGSLDEFFMHLTAPRLGYMPEYWEIRSKSTYSDFIGHFDNLADKKKDQGESRKSPYSAGRDSYTALRDLNRDTLFPMGVQAKSMLRAFITYTLEREMLVAAGVELAAQEWEQAGNPIQFMHFSLQKPRLERPNLLSPEIMAAYYEDIRFFNQSTGGFFVPDVLKNDTRWFKGL